VFGSETDQTVRAFQRQQRLTVDGVAGAQTLARLDQLLIQTGRDPLMVAFTDLRRLGASLVRAATAGSSVMERRQFEDRLRDFDVMALGNALRLAVFLRTRLAFPLA
jgi:hypothetical protein